MFDIKILCAWKDIEPLEFFSLKSNPKKKYLRVKSNFASINIVAVDMESGEVLTDYALGVKCEYLEEYYIYQHEEDFERDLIKD